MKGASTPQKPMRGTSASNVRGQLLGQAITTKGPVPTSARPIGGEVQDILKPLNAGKAFVSMDLLTAWPDLVGERLAGLCLPVRMRAKPKSRSRHKKPGDDGATLEVSADPAIAIDLDYGQTLIVERINAFYGYHAVSALKVVPKSEKSDAKRFAPRQPAVRPTKADVDDAHRHTQHVDDEGLRKALDGLGAAILRTGRAKR